MLYFLLYWVVAGCLTVYRLHDHDDFSHSPVALLCASVVLGGVAVPFRVIEAIWGLFKPLK